MNTETTPAPKEVPQPASGDVRELAMGLAHEMQRKFRHAMTCASNEDDLENESPGTAAAWAEYRTAREALRVFLKASFAASGAPQEAPGDAPSDKLDAAQYRWLREKGCYFYDHPHGPYVGSGQFLDAKIDAAMKGPQ